MLISFAALVTIVGALFFAGKPQLSNAQNDGFKLYQLLVFCGNSGLPSADSPNGKYCCNNMPEKGGLFASGTTVPVGIIYSEASTDSRVVGTQGNGTRSLHPNQTN